MQFLLNFLKPKTFSKKLSLLFSLPLIFFVLIITAFILVLDYTATLAPSPWQLILSLIVILIIFVVLANKVISKTLQPIQEITNIIQKFSSNPNLTNRLKVEGESEVKNLAININKMLDTLQSRDAELADYRSGLESQVEERTTALLSAIEEAKNADKVKTEFLARMSHEIRTPMNAIVGLTRLIQNTNLTPQQQSYQEQVIASSEMLLNLINDILDFSKIEAGKLKIEKISYNLEQVFQKVSYQVALNAQEKGLELLFHISKKVPTKIKGDPYRLSQVLINLVNNAVKFTQEGEVVVNCQLKTIQQQDYLKFTVKDTGIGIPKNKLSALFSPFHQVDSTMTRRFGGTGLGLAICKQLVELMQGEVEVKSKLNKGSKFSFILPLTAIKKSSQANKPLQKVIDSIKGLKVLLVDDKSSARKVLSSMLKQMGLKVDVAASGQEAIEILSSADAANNYNLVLLDWLMPEMDGIEVVRQIKLASQEFKLPVILMVTTGSYEKIIPSAARVGIKHVINKPISKSVLFDLIIEALIANNTIALSRNSLPKLTKELAPELDLTFIQYAKILLVDDIELNRMVAKAYLEEVGIYNIDIAENGLEAIEKIQANNYDLVLMDIQMPVMDGLTATEEIRKLSQYKDLPIIAMTAHANEKDKELSLAKGMNDHLTKSIEPEKLYSSLLKWIPHKEAVSKPRVVSKSADAEVTTNQIDLAKVDNIDTEKGLIHSLNRVDVYLKILENFNVEFNNYPTQIKQAIKLKDLELARRLAHSLKSSAATIGANELSFLARDIEFNFTKLGKIAPEKLSALGKELEVVIQDIHQLTASIEIPADTTQVIEVSTSALQALIKDFKALLEADDAACLTLLNEIMSYNFNAEVEELLIRIKDLVDDIEYDEALILLPKLNELLLGGS